VPINTRFANRDTVLPHGGGKDGKEPVLVPKGTIVMYSVWAMHRRKDIYGSDADEFRPERWENGGPQGSLRPGWAFLPFNGGPRICIGQQYALTEAGYTIVRLLQTFETIENRDPHPWQEHLGVTLSSHHGTKVSLGKRVI
jgi:cytochrome P450